MSTPGRTPDVDEIDFSDIDTEDLFASPSRPNGKRTDPTADLQAALDGTGNIIQKARINAETRYDTEEAREALLRKELEGVRRINEVIEGVVEGLEKAKGNMETVSRTVNSASTLLNTWIRILSQTEHNQRLLTNPNWQGASQDVADVENESILKQQAAERREIEEQQRRDAAVRKAEEEERQRAAGLSSRGTRGRGRGRGRGTARGPSNSSTGYVGVGGQGSTRGASRGSTPGKAPTGIGRGVPGSTRGRGRGAK